MAIPKITATDVVELADTLGYKDVREWADEYATLMVGLLAAYDAVDDVPDTPVLATRKQVEFWRPSEDEDPHNAWYVKTSIKGAAQGPLSGLTLAVKDNILVAGIPMMNGATALENFVPTVDATIVTRALEAGAEVIGKTACEYFCLSGGSHTNAVRPTHNPRRRGWSSGGSSSGSAVVLVTGDADLALGADQAGSIRMPASYSGIVGMKPTYSLVPYSGVEPIEPFFDHVGPMTKNVTDNARLLQVIAGDDGVDPRQRGVVVGDYLSGLESGVNGLRVGVLREGFGHPTSDPEVDRIVLEAVTVLERLGADVSEVSIPLHLVGPAIWTPIAIEGLTETARVQGFGLSRQDYYLVDLMEELLRSRGQSDTYPPNLKLFTMTSRYVENHVGHTYYGKAVNRTRTLRAAYDAALRDYDILITPTTPMAAQPLPDPAAGPLASVKAATEMFTNTCPFDITHHPAISIPCGDTDGLPVGLQMIGRHFDEATLYRAAFAYESARV